MIKSRDFCSGYVDFEIPLYRVETLSESDFVDISSYGACSFYC